jgi:hypothetical protein
MNVYHLYALLQGLAAVYFLTVTMPSLALDLYLSYNLDSIASSTLPLVSLYTPRAAPAPAPPRAAISFFDSLDEPFSPVPVCHPDPDEIDTSVVRKPGICPRPPLLPRPHSFVLPPAVHEPQPVRAPYAAVYTPVAVPLVHPIPEQGRTSSPSSSSALGTAFYILALGIVLGAAYMRGRAAARSDQPPAHQPPQDDLVDFINAERLRQVLPAALTDDDASLEEDAPADISVSQMDVFGLFARPRECDVFAPFAVAAPMAAVPLAGTGAVGCTSPEQR